MIAERGKVSFKTGSIHELWSYAIRERTPDPEGAVGKLIRTWANALNSEVVSFETEENIALFLLDLSQLMLKGLDVNLVMVVQTPNNLEDERAFYLFLERYAEKAALAHCLCFIIYLQDNAPDSKKYHPELMDIVVLDGNRIRKQLESSIPQFLLFDAIVQQVRINRLCPFDTTRPARGEMFTGRRDELRCLLQDLDTSFIVTGSRRVGKSSLIRKAVDLLAKKNDYQDRVFLMNCETWGRYESCARQIANRIYLKKEIRIDKGVQNLLNFFKLQSKYGRRPLLLFLDEFDRVTEVDKSSGWRLLQVLHTSVDNGWIRVVFVGYRSVSYIRDYRESPFFERIKLLRLPPLEDRDAIGLFTNPFRKVGIDVLEPEKIGKRIISTSAGFPFVIQFYGENLFNDLAKKEKMSLGPTDIEQFEKSFEFGDFIVSFFTENTKREERLLTMLYAYSEESRAWNEGDFLEKTKEVGIRLSISDIHKACRNLVLANIFKFNADRYDFVFPVLKNRLIRQWPDLNLKELYEDGGFG